MLSKYFSPVPKSWRSRLTVVVVLTITAIHTVTPLATSSAYPHGYLAYFADDFFYYVTIAANTVDGHVSSFDRITATNGYHPLWAAFLTGLAFLFDARQPIYFHVLFVFFALTTLLSTYCFIRLTRNVLQISPMAAATAAAFFCFLYVRLAASGMEVVITIPLALGSMLWFHRLWLRPTLRAAMVFALTASLTILSRLDTGLLYAGLAGSVLCSRAEFTRGLVSRRVATGLALGVLPLLVYGIANSLLFGNVIPISGQAKQLCEGFSWNMDGLRQLLVTPIQKLVDRHQVIPIATVTFPLFLLVLRTFVRVPPKPDYNRLPVLIIERSILWFVPLFYGVTFLSSDWQLWDWYYYPLVLAAPLAGARLFDTLARGDKMIRVLFAVCAVSTTGLGGMSILRASPQRNGIFVAAVEISKFSETHPGRYAMGDRAGVTSFLLGRDLVQLEGLVGSPDMLALIRDETPLDQVLDLYEIDYYIGTRYAIIDTCYEFFEPKTKQAGSRSPKMRGVICGPALFYHCDAGGVETVILRVGPEADRGPPPSRVTVAR